MPPHLTDLSLVNKNSIAAVLSATRRACQGEFVSALKTGRAISLKSSPGTFDLLHLLSHSIALCLTTTPLPSTFCRSRWTMDEVESLRLGGAADATDFAGDSRNDDEKNKKKEEVDNRGHGRMAPVPTPPATATTAMATTAMTPSAGLCGESHSLGGGAPLVSASLDSLSPSVPLFPPFH